MNSKNYNIKRKKRVRKKPLRIAVFAVLFIGIAVTVSQYFKFVSETVYEESVSHLTEVFHQSDNMLRGNRVPWITGKYGRGDPEGK